MNSEVTEWLALHRVHQGGMAKLHGQYLNTGRPVAEFLIPAFDELISTELLALERPDPLGYQRVCVTHTGQVRYTQLRDIAVRTGMVQK